jgi:hypothetical protein
MPSAIAVKSKVFTFSLAAKLTVEGRLVVKSMPGVAVPPYVVTNEKAPVISAALVSVICAGLQPSTIVTLLVWGSV